jgi:hypothetical protein
VSCLWLSFFTFISPLLIPHPSRPIREIVADNKTKRVYVDPVSQQRFVEGDKGFLTAGEVKTRPFFAIFAAHVTHA